MTIFPHAASATAAVNPGNIEKVDLLIKRNKRVSAKEIPGILVSKTTFSRTTLETISGLSNCDIDILGHSNEKVMDVVQDWLRPRGFFLREYGNYQSGYLKEMF